MKDKNVKDIQNEIVNIVTNFYRDGIEIINEKTLPEQFEIISETVSFIFEDYRERFVRLKQLESNVFEIERNVEIEMKLFIAWCTMHVLERLKNEIIDTGKSKMEIDNKMELV